MVSLCQALVLNVGDTRIIIAKSPFCKEGIQRIGQIIHKMKKEINVSKEIKHRRVIENIARFYSFKK